MTRNNRTASAASAGRRPRSRRSLGSPLPALAIALALAVSACTEAAPVETVFGDAPASSTTAGDEEVGPKVPDETSAPTTTAPEADAPTPSEPEEAQRPPGTINDLDDIIDNESSGGLQRMGDDMLIERFVAALLAATSDLAISTDEARCVGERVQDELSVTSFELLITNLETDREVDERQQFSNAELLVISDALADCIDLRQVVDDVVDGDAVLGDLVRCLSVEIGVDRLEALVLFEVIGERGFSALLLEGLDRCPTEGRAAVDEQILREFLLADEPAIRSCLAQITDDDLRPFLETGEFGDLIRTLRAECLS